MYLRLSVALAALTIFGNIYINGISVGHLVPEAALAHLEEEIPISREEIIITAKGARLVYTFADFAAGYDFEAAVAEAVDYSQNCGFFKGLARKLALKLKDRHIEAVYGFDEEVLDEIVQEIVKKLTIRPVEPDYSIQNGQFKFTDGKIGRQICEVALTKDILALLTAKQGGTVNAQITEVSPKYNRAQFEAATDLIGSFATPFNPTDINRATNLAVAAAYLNNRTILPAQVFSTCAALRRRTAENGYVRAAQILNGEPDTGIGGGICQISSTLYMAVLHAELPIRERRPHSLMVSYAPPATDAALAEGHIDLKFENNTDNPVLIETILDDRRGELKINIYGHETRPIGRSITFITVPKEGTDQIVKYELHKIIAENGQVRQEKINSSNYKQRQIQPSTE